MYTSLQWLVLGYNITWRTHVRAYVIIVVLLLLLINYYNYLDPRYV